MLKATTSNQKCQILTSSKDQIFNEDQYSKIKRFKRKFFVSSFVLIHIFTLFLDTKRKRKFQKEKKTRKKNSASLKWQQPRVIIRKWAMFLQLNCR